MLSTKIYELHGVRVLECVPDGTTLRTYQDAVDLIGKTFENRATLIVIPVECLEDEFFQLKTRIAGELIQKFVQYRRRLVIVGDISRHLAEQFRLARFCRRIEPRQGGVVPREPRRTRTATRADGLTRAASAA